ncbi:MAG: hypothetical protein F8N36_04650 [Desulfovibrio sp.]|nr:hypothetical protein [Desulfovibrio sp.]
MKYSENLSIILMRDNGPRRSYRVRRARFVAALTVMACMPLLCAVLGWLCWTLWQQNVQLRDNVLRFESDYQVAQANAERLENLEELLREENIPGRELVLRRLGTGGAAAEAPGEGPAAPASNAPAAEKQAKDQPKDAARANDGPGHEDFPSIDLDYVKVGNVQVREIRGGKLRLALDLRNTDSQKILSGVVSGTLLTADGKTYPLRFDQEDVGNFRISRFKRAVMVAATEKQISLTNAQVILEVRSQENTVVFRNIFAVEH